MKFRQVIKILQQKQQIRIYNKYNILPNTLKDTQLNKIVEVLFGSQQGCQKEYYIILVPCVVNGVGNKRFIVRKNLDKLVRQYLKNHTQVWVENFIERFAVTSNYKVKQILMDLLIHAYKTSPEFYFPSQRAFKVLDQQIIDKNSHLKWILYCYQSKTWVYSQNQIINFNHIHTQFLEQSIKKNQKSKSTTESQRSELINQSFPRTNIKNKGLITDQTAINLLNTLIIKERQCQLRQEQCQRWEEQIYYFVSRINKPHKPKTGIDLKTKRLQLPGQRKVNNNKYRLKNCYQPRLIFLQKPVYQTHSPIKKSIQDLKVSLR